MTNPGRQGVIGRTRGAAALIARAESLARLGGLACPTRGHWIVVAAERQLMVRTLFPGVDVEAMRNDARSALERGGAEAPLPADKVEALAIELASTRGCTSVHELDLVWAILRHAGFAEPAELAAAISVADPPRSARATAAAGSAAGGVPVDGPDDAGSSEPDESRAAGNAVDASPSPGSPPADVAGQHRSAGRPAPLRQTKASNPGRARSTPMLDRCGRDLTALAAQGALAAVVGRDAELAHVIQTLSRPTKANPLLVGEPGVGKTALVEGLATRIAAGDVPAHLRGRRVVAVDMSQVVAEAGHYGGLEQRLDALIGEARAIRAILFFDEGHAMIGAGGREGTADVASYLKPVLARGDLSIISATTDDEYRRLIAPSAALERRFVVIRVHEPTPDAVRVILRTIAATTARDSGIAVDEAALDHVVALAAVRFPHRRQPDKSKDLLEQAIAQAVARGETRVARADVEAAADRLAGSPVAGGDRLATLAAELVARSVVGPADAAAIAGRLGLALEGLTLRPERPRAVLLATGDGSVPSDGELAATIAEHVFGGRDRVVVLDLAPITEPALISSLLGTPQGYVGHGTVLPIHRLAQQPFCVVRFLGLGTCHPVARTVVAQAIRDGYLTDGTGRRVFLSSAVLVLEARAAGRARRRLGFSAGSAAAFEGSDPVGPPSAGSPERAVELLGEELGGECDLVLSPPAGPVRARAAGIGRVLCELAERYRAAGLELTWNQAVEAWLAAGAGRLGQQRARERFVEERVWRAVQASRGEAGTGVAKVSLVVGDGGIEVHPAVDSRES